MKKLENKKFVLKKVSLEEMKKMRIKALEKGPNNIIIVDYPSKL